MVAELLVDADIDAGRELVATLDAAGFRVEAAFWWLDDKSWRLIIGTPVVNDRGRIRARDEFSHALASLRTKDQFEPILDRVDLLSPGEGVFTVLDIVAGSDLPMGRRVDREGFRGVWIEGAYFYRFEPVSFIPSEE